MTDILARIAEYKRTDVAGRKAARPQAEVEAAAAFASPPRGFAAALDAKARPGRLAGPSRTGRRATGGGRWRWDTGGAR